jgi:peptidoglycan hydrolase-like protein with peptidoglycan-binding domain
MQIKELYKKFLKAKGADIKYRNLAAGKKMDVSKKGLWDKKKRQVIVPSNRITMKGPNGEQDFFKKPVVATGLQSGQRVMMQPGGEYYFPNDKAVHEVRMQNGGNILSMGDYDLTTAPKKGNYLLPDINRPSYKDESGNRRSEYKMGFNIDGKETVVPTVVGGRQLSEDEAVARYRKTGLHMGQYNTPEEADYAARSRTAKYNMLEDPVRFQANQFQVGGKKEEEDSTIENIAEFFDPTGVTSYDDASRAYDEWKKSNATLPSMSQALDMFGAVPALGKFGKIKYLADPAAMKAVYKSIPWQDIVNAFDTVGDETSKAKPPVKKEYGGLTGKYQNGGMAELNPNTLGFQEGGSVQTDITTPIKQKQSASQDAFNAMLDKYEANKSNLEGDASTPEDMGFQTGGELPVVIDSLFSNFQSGIGKKYAQQGMAVPGINGTVVASTNAPIDSEKRKMQEGGWNNWAPKVDKPYMRTSPAGNAGYSDNTRVVTQNTNVSPANRKAAEAAGPEKTGDSFINSVEATLNPKNWGVTDYTKSGTRAQAFSAARKAGEKEFMWNNERFNTRKDTDPIQYTGNNPNQEVYDEVLRTQYPEFFKMLNRGQNVGNISFEGAYSDQPNRAFLDKNPNLLSTGNSKVGVGQNPSSSQDFIGNLIAETGHLKDKNLDESILNPYSWKARIDNTRFGETKYKVPGTAEYNAHRLIEPGAAMVAYGNLSPADIKRIQKNLGVKEDGYFGETTYNALQNKYKDNNYIQTGVQEHQYYTGDQDKNPIRMGHLPALAKRYLHELNKEVPLKYYDRFAENTKRSDYTDAALLSTSGDNMHPLLLQDALRKRGYTLPKSTIKTPSNYNRNDSRYYNLDGKYGEETKNALLDWQNKNSIKQQNGGTLDQFQQGGKVAHSNDKDMVNGVASILRRVEDKDNRQNLAKQLSKQFDREKVRYNLSDFLNKSKVKK